MFYYAIFTLTLTILTRQAFMVHHIKLNPSHKYQHSHQDSIYSHNTIERVNIYLTECLSNPITATAQTYYWIKKAKKHIQLTLSKYSIARDRSSQRLLLLLLSGIETNPGPRRPRFPCTICQKACKLESIACDDCDKWTKLHWNVYNRIQQSRQERRHMDMSIMLKTQQLFDKSILYTKWRRQQTYLP